MYCRQVLIHNTLRLIRSEIRRDTVEAAEAEQAVHSETQQVEEKEEPQHETDGTPLLVCTQSYRACTVPCTVQQFTGGGGGLDAGSGLAVALAVKP